MRAWLAKLEVGLDGPVPPPPSLLSLSSPPCFVGRNQDTRLFSACPGSESCDIGHSVQSALAKAIRYISLHFPLTFLVIQVSRYEVYLLLGSQETEGEKKKRKMKKGKTK